MICSVIIIAVRNGHRCRRRRLKRPMSSTFLSTRYEQSFRSVIARILMCLLTEKRALNLHRRPSLHSLTQSNRTYIEVQCTSNFRLFVKQIGCQQSRWRPIKHSLPLSVVPPGTRKIIKQWCVTLIEATAFQRSVFA